MHRAILFVASSDSAPGMGSAGNTHHVTALRVEAASGALSAHGDPIPLPTRPIHMTTDIPSEHLLVAFSNTGAKPEEPGALTAFPNRLPPGGADSATNRH